MKRNLEEVELYFKDVLNTRNKKIHFLSSRLRSGSEIYKKGGHVTMVYKDQSYSLQYDNKRKISDEIVSKPSLRDSSPMIDVDEALLFRKMSEFGSKTSYQKSLPQKTSKTYKSNLEVGIRNFIKALFSNELNLDSSFFANYKELILFIEGFKSEKKYRLTPNTIALLKSRKNSRVLVAKTKEVENFVCYLKTKFPNFDDKGFLV